MRLTSEQWARLERERAGKGPGHPEIDRRTQELTRLAVTRIDEDPALVQTDSRTVYRSRFGMSDMAQEYASTLATSADRKATLRELGTVTGSSSPARP